MSRARPRKVTSVVLPTVGRARVAQPKTTAGLGDASRLGVPRNALDKTRKALARPGHRQRLSKLERYTIFLDIDGVLVKGGWDGELLDTAKLWEWWDAGYKIILTTGRPETMRAHTVKTLGVVPYHQLIMDVGDGPRVVINDLKPYSDRPMAIALNLKRNEGLCALQ